MKKILLIIVLSLPSFAWGQRTYSITSSQQQTMRGVYMAGLASNQQQISGALGCSTIPDATITNMIADFTDFGYTGMRRTMWLNKTLPKMHIEGTNDNADPNVFAGLTPYDDTVWGFNGGDVDCGVATTIGIQKWVMPLRTAVQNTGAPFEMYADFFPGAFTSMRSFWQSDPNEGAEMTLAYAQWFHSITGFYPNFYAWNEGDWNYYGASKWMGNWAKDVGDRLNTLNGGGVGHLQIPEDITPTDAGGKLDNANTAFTASGGLTQQQVAGQYIPRVTFHDYDYSSLPYPAKGSAAITNRNGLRTRAQSMNAETGSYEGAGWWNSSAGVMQDDGTYNGGLSYWRNWFLNITEANASVVAKYNSLWRCGGGSSPPVNGTCANNLGGATIILQADNVANYWLFPNYWAMRQFAHWVKPGYVRLAATCSNCGDASLPDINGAAAYGGPDMKCMAFQRPDTGMTLTCLNDTTGPQTITLSNVNAGTYNLHKLDSSMCSGTAKNRCTPNDSATQATVSTTLTLSSVPAGAVWVADQQVSGADTTPPVASITAPSGTIFGVVSVTASCTDNSGSCAGVQFKLDGSNLGTEDTTAPYSISWDTTGLNGNHTLSCQARDAAGNTSTCTGVVVTVSAPDTTPPVATITAPTGTINGTVSVTAGCTDDSGACASVQFKLDGANLGALTTGTFSTSWDTTTATAGAHTLSCVALDPTGNSSNCPNVVVTVSNQTPSGLDIYGGCTTCGVTGTVTGYYHTQKINGRWWFIDPLGNPYWHRAIQNLDANYCGANCGTGKKYASTAQWGQGVHARIGAWGFTGYGVVGTYTWTAFPTFTPKKPYTYIIPTTTYATDPGVIAGCTKAHAVNDLVPAVSFTAYGQFEFRGNPLIDAYDPVYATFAQCYFSASNTFPNTDRDMIHDPYLVGWVIGDADKWFGMSGGQAPTSHPKPHPGYMVLSSNPTINAITNYAKAALITYLQGIYGTTSPNGPNNDGTAAPLTLNQAWGISSQANKYTQWNSAGTYGSGTAFADENGRNPWICATNPCTQVDWQQLVAFNATAHTDMDGFLRQFTARMSGVLVTAIKSNTGGGGFAAQPDTNHLIIGPDAINNWGFSTWTGSLQGFKDSGLDVLYASYDIRNTGTWPDKLTAGTSSYDAAGLPMVAWIGMGANLDSQLSSFGCSPDDDPAYCDTQEHRGTLATNHINGLLNQQGTNGDHFWIGYEWWDWAGSAGEHENWGLVSGNDNAYDALESVTGIVSCSSDLPAVCGANGTSACACGGETDPSAPFGNFIAAIKAANFNVYKQLSASPSPHHKVGGGRKIGGGHKVQ